MYLTPALPSLNVSIPTLTASPTNFRCFSFFRTEHRRTTRRCPARRQAELISDRMIVLQSGNMLCLYFDERKVTSYGIINYKHQNHD